MSRACVPFAAVLCLWATPSTAQQAVAFDSTAAEVRPATSDPLVARESVHPTGFPRILILDDPGSPVVTFRLSIPVDATVDAATAAPILQRMAEGRISGSARTLGARVEAGASATAISYTLTGAAADLDHLTYILRQATRAPQASQGFAAARSELQATLARIGETGEGQVESQLRGQASPGDPSVAEVRERLRRLSFFDVEAFWRASHRPEQMTLIVVGDVATPPLLAALSGLGAQSEPEPPREPTPPSPPVRDRPDLLRRWLGFGWTTSPTLDPRAVVVASLAARHLRDERDQYEAYVRLWEGRNSDVLAVVGSTYPRDAAALERRLAGIPAEMARASDAEIDDAVERLEWSLLAQARTPWGRATLVGRFLEAGGSADAARSYVDALTSLTADDVRAFASTLQAARPTRVEVR